MAAEGESTMVGEAQQQVSEPDAKKSHLQPPTGTRKSELEVDKAISSEPTPRDALPPSWLYYLPITSQHSVLTGNQFKYLSPLGTSLTQITTPGMAGCPCNPNTEK